MLIISFFIYADIFDGTNPNISMIMAILFVIVGLPNIIIHFLGAKSQIFFRSPGAIIFTYSTILVINSSLRIFYSIPSAFLYESDFAEYWHMILDIFGFTQLITLFIYIYQQKRSKSYLIYKEVKKDINK